MTKRSNPKEHAKSNAPGGAGGLALKKISTRDLKKLILQGWELQEEMRAVTAPLRTVGDRELSLILD